VETFSGDAEFFGVPSCAGSDTTYRDTSDVCVGDSLFFGGLCSYEGTVDNFTYMCDQLIEGPFCNIELKTMGSGQRSGASFTQSIQIIQSYVGENCSGACTTLINTTSTRIGEPDCPSRKAPGRSPFVRLPELSR